MRRRERKRPVWVTKEQMREAARILDPSLTDRQFERMWNRMCAEKAMHSRTGGRFKVIEGG